MKKILDRIAILGAGNIGISLARGLVKTGKFKPGNIILTRRSKMHFKEIAKEGFDISDDNAAAVKNSDLLVISVLPQQLNHLLNSISSELDLKRHLVISVVSGVSTKNFLEIIDKEVQLVRAMPNTAIAIGESMTCIASSNAGRKNLDYVKSLFESVGEVLEIKEELMTSATALNACGIAFFLRAIRAASQGGVQIGFHAEEALKMASQTAKGAAALLLHSGSHPESEIDKVTSPEGCTIAGLNEMEHQGFSSALIRGITTSAAKASGLYKKG